MKKYALIFVLILVITVAVTGCSKKSKDSYKTESITKHTIIETVEASGTINPVVTVNIGTQVSGIIKEIFVDFNSSVKKGQLLAEIDPSLFQAQVDKARGDLAAAQANYQKANSTYAYNRKNYERYKNMYEKNYVAKTELDLAESTYKSDAAQLNAAKASINQAKASLDNNLTNLKYTKIVSPVDGVVISRNVDVGQTVAASFQTPTLFMVAQDLNKMQIEVNVSEADIGKVKNGQEVTYTLDGYPDLTFKGVVSQVRISPTTISNVVTYTIVVQVDNESGKLIPGMSANVTIVTNKKEDVFAVPSEALRFTDEKLSEGKKYKEQGIWVMANGQKPERINIATGIRDGEFTEVITDKPLDNLKVITGKNDKDGKGKGGQGGKGPQVRPMRMF